MSSIDSVMVEKRIFPPSAEFTRQANLSLEDYNALCARAQNDYPGYWEKLARDHMVWRKPFTQVLDESNAPFYRWFADGTLNASYNCLDRHIDTIPNKPAIIFEGDDGQVTTLTYIQLYHRVCQFANGLKALGVKKGDRVLVYMPMSVEAVISMQACARIGAIHSVVFGGFSAKSVQERIVNGGAKVVITADEQVRGGRTIPLKAAVDEALAMGCDTVKKVVVYQRTSAKVAMDPKRDITWEALVAGQADDCEPTWVGAEDPLFILFTSGSTGRPKGVVHATGGFLLGAITSMKWTFDIKSNDVFWCTADVGWITGHTYVAYGPLSVGATQVMFEGIPTYPDASRFWQLIAKHKVTVFYTAPTAIRSLIKAGADLPKEHDLSSLRLLGSVGEPINPEAWIWYYTMVGKSRCPIVDTWWQTETGCHMISPMPGATPLKPGSCTFPLPGIQCAIVDETGEPVEKGKGGLLVITRPFPSQIRTLWDDPDRFKTTYFPEELRGHYLAGDSANRDLDGYFWIMGRVDDVLNVSGHRLGTMEVESALVANPLIAEAAVVGRPHDIKGEAIVAFVVLKQSRPSEEEAKRLAIELKNWVAKEIGPIAKPDSIHFGDNLPKTRSGKIMRRLLRSIAKGEEINQDISTLENPGILEQLKQAN
ncbi:MAG: acetate--CoA ligase [Betaproteobacteria bacterium]